MRMRVIVADNDETPSARDLTESLSAELGLDHVYLHAPARNISIARNACLQAAKAPLVAFIDDDEQATPTWLGRLVKHLDDSGADVVFGPVVAIYPRDAPGWLRKADLHSIRPISRPGRGIETGYSCNVLLTRACAGDLRFDPSLGRSGGEDTVFFHELRQRGATLAFASDAVVTEIVTTQRQRLAWLLKRSFRNGQTHARILRARGGPAALHAAASFAKTGYCAATAAFTVFAPDRSARALVRGALHCGALASFLGLADLKLY
jgi:succinoglycan biosynthesis protein ExoM